MISFYSVKAVREIRHITLNQSLSKTGQRQRRQGHRDKTSEDAEKTAEVGQSWETGKTRETGN
jgi:hypothetical protein